MAEQTGNPAEEGPLPRFRAAVDRRLKQWGRQAVLDGKEPLTRSDVLRLIEVNGGTAEGLDLASRDLSAIDLGPTLDGQGEFHGLNLRGVLLSEAQLQNASLGQARLQGAYLDFANLTGANLNAANLDKAKLFGAKLQKVSFLLASLQEADLSGATLQGALLSPAYLTGANFSNSDLSGAILEDNDLEHVALNGANLRGADLRGCKLQGNNLERIDIRDSQLQKSDLRGTNLSGCDLRGANLASARISSDTDLEGVIWDKGYISILEGEQRYQEAISLYRRLKEWHQFAGMGTVAGKFHYREREAARKAEWQRLGHDFKEFKRELVAAWRQFRGKTGSA